MEKIEWLVEPQLTICIQKHMLEKGIKPTQLRDMTGLAYPGIQKLMQGVSDSHVPVRSLAIIASVLECDPSEFLSYTQGVKVVSETV